MKTLKLITGIGLVLFASFSILAQGTVIADRSTLNIWLNSGRIDEDFETLLVNSGGVVGYGNLNMTNNWGGIETTGITYESTGNMQNYSITLAANDAGPGTTKTICAGVGLRLDFWEPVTAFGLDLKDYPSTRTVLTAGISIYGADDSTLLYQTDTFNITDPANGTFFGYQNPGGIGMVVLTTAVPGPYNNNMSAFIDNLSFSPVPEPSTVALGLLSCGALAVLARKRKY